MTDPAKLQIAGQTYFIVIKSNSRMTGFYDGACYHFYLLRLLNCLNNFQVKLHAYILLENSIWLLTTPGTPGGLSSLLKYLNQCYSSYFNNRFGRSTTIWRDLSGFSLVQGNQLVLDCQKFIERAPVQAMMVNHPGEYAWSSYCANSFGGATKYLTPHPAFKLLLQENGNPYKRYRDFIASSFDEPYYRYLKSRLMTGTPVAKRKQKLLQPIARKRRLNLLDPELDATLSV